MDLIVNFTPTGMIPTKPMTPHVPVSVQEIVEDVQEATEIGITMVHLHARDPVTGKPTYHADIYAELITRIREFAPDLVITVSLSGRTFNKFSERAAPLKLSGALKPDMGSLTLSSLNFNRQASVNAPEMIQALAEEMRKRQIVPELEVFDVGMINYSKYLENKGVIQPPYYYNLIFNNIACAQADLLHMGLMVRDLPPGSLWSFGGVGNAQIVVNTVAIAIGGGVRIGLEDNIWYDPSRKKLSRNRDLLKRVHDIATTYGRKPMTASELRKLLNLKPGYGEYGSL
jgi:uncharacterized protein (DUF849 family)